MHGQVMRVDAAAYNPPFPTPKAQTCASTLAIGLHWQTAQLNNPEA